MSYVPFYDYLTKENIAWVEMNSFDYPNKGDIININQKRYIVIGKEYEIKNENDYEISILLKEQTTGAQPL